MFKCRRFMIILLVLGFAQGLAVLSAASGVSQAAVVPSDFQDQAVATLERPTALAFTPDARLLINEQGGSVRVYQGGQLASGRALDLRSVVCSDYERGLLGLAVDPDFSANHYIYVYYTYLKHGVCGTDPATAPVNRVSRFVLSDAGTVDPASEQILIDNIPSPSGVHNAGDLVFGKDDNLYVSVGDGGCDYLGDSGCGPYNDATRDLNVLLGKVLRVTRDGDVPAGNPFQGSDSDRCNLTGRTATGRKCRETFAWGLRNPFRIAVDPSSAETRLYINDVGQAQWEEINEGAAGADYGWNAREGHCAVTSATDCGLPPAGMVNPIFDYSHSDGCTAITLGDFVPAQGWPSSYAGSYMFGDLVCGKIFRLDPAPAGGYTATEFASGITNLIDGVFSPVDFPDPGLYYISWTGFPNDQVRRISFSGSANRSPEAAATASPAAGDLPLQVDFDGTASSDPDGDSLTYDWDFGDGSPHASSVTVGHTYTSAGTYTATLTVSDGNGRQDTQALRIDAGNNPPAPTIQEPAPSRLFSVGEDITLSGGATDPEDGPLPPSALTWVVIKHHATHTHPYLPPTTGAEVSVTAPQPEDLSSATNSYLEIVLTATDSKGLTTTVRQDLRPQTVNVGLGTNPSGLRLELNGLTAPSSFTSWAGWKPTLNAPDPQTDSAGQGETFVSWSDGGAQTHTITTPGSGVSYTAKFTRRYARPKGATPTWVPLVPAYSPCNTPNRTHGPPLAFGSCSPPVPTSSYLAVGTPDANGHPAGSTGSIRFFVQGDPATPEDDADVILRVSLTDVRDRNRSYVDYVGELQVAPVLRITDRQNGAGGSAGDSGTGVSTPLNFSVACAPTVENVGSTCATDTSADAITPGVVAEGMRSIWELQQVNVYDGGDDGLVSTGGNTLFARQGVFVP